MFPSNILKKIQGGGGGVIHVLALCFAQKHRYDIIFYVK